MITQAEDFERFLRVLDRQGCLPDVMVVGSWAEFLYREARLLNGFEPNLKTMDIDFLVRNMRKPQPPVNVLVAAREAGYVPDADYLDGTTKIYSDSGLEIEFLIGKKGAGREAALKTNIGVTAQALWHLDILSKHPVIVRWRGSTSPYPLLKPIRSTRCQLTMSAAQRRRRMRAQSQGYGRFSTMKSLMRCSVRLIKRSEQGSMRSLPSIIYRNRAR